MSPKLRQTIYLLGTVFSAAVSIALLWGGISADTASNALNIIAGLGGLFGTGASGTAAIVVSQQKKQGAFDEVNPVDAVINGVQAVTSSAASAAADLEKVKAAAADAFGSIPGIGPLAEQVISSVLSK
jgi:hypothetical protein